MFTELLPKRPMAIEKIMYIARLPEELIFGILALTAGVVIKKSCQQPQRFPLVYWQGNGGKPDEEDQPLISVGSAAHMLFLHITCT